MPPEPCAAFDPDAASAVARAPFVRHPELP
jgi:hypothetical protein